jgi:hypothetical protein
MCSSSRSYRASATRPISPTSPGRASAPAHPTPTQERAAVPRMASARVGRRGLVRQPHRLHPADAAPRLRRLLVGDKHFLRWARDGTWDRDLAPLHHGVRHGLRPQPPEPPAGVIDSCSINVSPVRGPGGFDGAKKIDGIKRYVVVDTLGLLVAVLVTAASVQDRAAVPRLLGRARYRCPGARPSVGRPGLHRQRRPGREQDPAVHDPDRGRDQAQGRLYHPASSLGRRAVFRPGCTAADASPASTRRPHWPMRPWSSSASTRSCSAASTE